MTDLEIGESAERFLKNKVNAIHSDKWTADIFSNKNSKKQNHKEGDLYFIYKNEEYFNCLIEIPIESKASIDYSHGLINVNFKHNTNVDDDKKDIKNYLSGMTHQFYISVGYYNPALENDTSAEFHYTLFRTIRFVNLMLKDDCKYCIEHKEWRDPNKADYILIRKFIKDILKYYETNSIQDLLDKLEEFILDNKEIIQEREKEWLKEIKFE